MPVPAPPDRPPAGVATSTLRYRVPFFDTDGMRIVHHANHVRYLELARVRFLEEHATPYEKLIARGLHFAVTRCEVTYRRAARFNDELDITCWLQRVRGASIAIGYVIEREGRELALAHTEHAMVDEDGRPARMPADLREELAALAVG